MYCWNGGMALVRTFVVLLRRSADSAELTGTRQREFPGEPPYLVFRYGVVRVWQLPAGTFLSGGLGILPFAPLGAVLEAELPDVIRRMEQRISAEATPDEAGTLWTATDVLMGLRYPRALVVQLLQGVHGMKESVTYQAIVEKGKSKAKSKAKSTRQSRGPPRRPSSTRPETIRAAQPRNRDGPARHYRPRSPGAPDRRITGSFQLGSVAGNEIVAPG